MNKLKKALYIIALSVVAVFFGKRLVCPVTAVILHELGHISAIKIFGGRVENLKADVCGANISAMIFDLSRFKRIIVYAAGGVTNIISGLISLYIGYYEFALCSFSLGIVNLLPIKTLDGGCILNEILIGNRFTDILSGVTVFSIWIISIVILILTGSVSLWIFSSCLFYSLYLKEKKLKL